MPWKETHVEDERQRFVDQWLRREGWWTMSELCVAYGISRKTGYKWLERFKAGGRAALGDQSRARRTQAHATPRDVVRALVRLRRRHASWGPRKLIDLIDVPPHARPAPSTVGAILKQHGLIVPRRRRPRATPTERADFLTPQAANDVWGADFKGWFRTRDGQRCDPLTISDLSSRFVLACQRVQPADGPAVRPVFAAVFREYGLPRAMRTDNGAPFASGGLGGLSALSVWWVKLGIRLERIEPGRPEQNGCHERMHRTLKRETACPPAANARAQQRAFNRFRRIFNWERPHEALGNARPAMFYVPSERRYPPREPTMEYAAHVPVRHVRTTGEIKWRGQLLYLSHALVGEPVSLEEIGNGHWLIRFGPVPLALVDEVSRTLLRIPPRGRRCASTVKNPDRPSGLPDSSPLTKG